MERSYYVYFRLLGNTKADKHCIKIKANNIKEAKDKVRRILNRKSKRFTIIMVSSEGDEI